MDDPEKVLDLTISLYGTDEEKLFAICKGSITKFERYHGTLEVQGKLNALLFIWVVLLGTYKRKTANRQNEESVNNYYKRIITYAQGLGIQVSELARYMNDKGKDFDLKDRVFQIKAPTLIVWGKHDGVVKFNVAEYFDTTIPISTLEIIENASHSPQLEVPEAVGEKIESFLIF